MVEIVTMNQATIGANSNVNFTGKCTIPSGYEILNIRLSSTAWAGIVYQGMNIYSISK